MKTTIKFSMRKYAFLFFVSPLFLFGCTLENSDQNPDLDKLNLRNSQLIDKLLPISEDKEFMNALKSAAMNPKNYVSPIIDINARTNKKWVAMASGGGLDLYPDSEEPNFEITFQAKEDAAGNDVGMVKWSNTNGDVIASGTVDCLYVDENKAWVRYVVEVGNQLHLIWIGFEDNGEGANAELDRHTYIYGGPAAIFSYISCEDFANSNGFGHGFIVEWVRGNVQVQ
jgi:hypothetical protein